MEDAFKFGLKNNDPIISKLNMALIRNTSRLTYYQNKVVMVKSILRNPKITLNAVLSELLRDLRQR